MFLDVVVVAHARSGETNELPADHVGVAAVDGIAKHAFNRVLAQQLEKYWRLALHALQRFVLLVGWKAVEAFQLFQSIEIDFARRSFALVSEFSRSLFKWL